MSPQEFADWQVFMSVHPLPLDLADIHHGAAMAMLANVNRTKSVAAFEAKDFFVLHRKPPQRARTMSIAEQMKAVAEGRPIDVS